MSRITRTLVATSLALAGTAAAEPAPSALSPHVNVGGEVNGGGEALYGGVRVHVGGSRALVTGGSVQPTFGLGVTFGSGALGIDDARALDGTVDLAYLDYGPEAQLGLRWGGRGAVHDRVFASLAYVRTRLDERLMIDAVDGVGGVDGWRAGVGLNWAATQAKIASQPSYDSDDEDVPWLIFLVPQQLEVGWQRSAGSDRIGVTLSYGL